MRAGKYQLEIEPSKPQFDILVSEQQVNLFLSGQSGGKTHCAGLLSGNLISNHPDVHGFIGANTYTQLSDSTLFRIRSVWKEFFGWSEYSKANLSGDFVVDINPPPHFNTEDHEYDSYHGKICFRWGTVVYKGSLDNYKAHDGKEFAWAILDETKDTKEEAVKEVILGRLREKGLFKGNESWNPLFIFTSPAKVKWINEWFGLQKYQSEITAQIYSDKTYFKKKIDNKMVVISSAYHNLSHLPPNFIINQKKNLRSSLQDLLIYGNPFSQSGGEYFPSFNRTIHVGRPKYIPNDALAHSFDFNTMPYMTSHQYQVEKIDSIWWVKVIDETCTPPPKNRPAPLCREILKKYKGHPGGGFYTGDWNGKSSNTALEEKYEHQYQIVEEILWPILSKRKPDRTVTNKPVSKRRDFVMDLLEERVPIRLLIHEKCVNLIDDMVYLKEDPKDGGKLKEEATDEITGKKYQKLGHSSDDLEYFLSSTFPDYI